MIIRGIDSNGDWVYGQGLNSYNNGQAAIEENIKTKILEWKNDCFFNQEAGIDWVNRLGSSDIDGLDTALKNLIAACYGVTSLIEVNLDYTDRVFSVSYTIDTIFSTNVQNTITNS